MFEQLGISATARQTLAVGSLTRLSLREAPMPRPQGGLLFDVRCRAKRDAIPQQAGLLNREYFVYPPVMPPVANVDEVEMSRMAGARTDAGARPPLNGELRLSVKCRKIAPNRLSLCIFLIRAGPSFRQPREILPSIERPPIMSSSSSSSSSSSTKRQRMSALGSGGETHAVSARSAPKPQAPPRNQGQSASGQQRFCSLLHTAFAAPRSSGKK
ncbi:hypothetical protein Emed_000726 [Eimeria media]